MTQIPEEPVTHGEPPRNLRLPWLIVAGTAVVILVGVGLAWRASSRLNKTPLSASPKNVGTIEVKSATYRIQHRYVGALLAWNESKLGPQFVSGYVTEVRYRPGAVVHKGETLAIIDPEMAKNKSTASQKQAEAIKAQLWALTRESERIQGLEKKGIISVNDAERKLAGVQSEQAKLQAAQAQMASSDLEVQDTIQRAPFDGEIANRYLDPGAFVHPGDFILEVVDRSKVRCSTDAPEEDHPFLAVGRSVHMHLLANSRELDAKISRVSPGADPGTRTIHFEVDLENKDRSIPVGTTAEMLIKESEGRKVIQVPSSAAKVEGTRATLFVIVGDRAHKKVLPFLGESEGLLYLAPDLPEGSRVVLDGRNQLEDGDQVIARPATGSVPEAGVQP
ncbi:MAG: efflux RND transporter periplasmic adaptor subunit [Geothrix sp.]|nr:efflux RND transporter periplasmic adaptor subunit [Geothrix sp.]